MGSIAKAEPLAVRFGLVGAGVICWQGATHVWESGSPVIYPLSVALMLSGYLIGFILFILAALRSPHPWAHRVILPALLLAIACHVQVHRIAILQNGMLTTDLQLYMDYGARLLRHGENPYAENLLEAYRINRAPFNFSTLLINGDLTGRMAYPALSVLVFVPFQWLGISTQWVYLVFLIVALTLVFVWSPRAIRPIVLLPFFLDIRYFLYTIGGVSDCVWALLLVVVVRTWHRPWHRGVWYGLACAFKHQPWVLAPFLLVRLWQESRPAQRLRTIAIFAGISAGTFLVVNLPFLIWNPRAWFAGVLEPVISPMITFGQGLSLLTMLGVAVVPKWAYGLFMVGALGVSLFAYLRHFNRLRPLIWILPGLVLWFSNRSLTSYWYFFLFPFLFDLFSARTDQPEAEPRPNPGSWRPTLAATAGLLAVITGTVLWFRLYPPPLDVNVVPPLGSTGNDVTRLTVRVTNSGARAITPRFAVQWGVLQPFFWHIDKGPQQLRPRQSGLYSISSDIPFARFDIRRGARLTVSHAGSFDTRATVRIAPDPAFVYPDAIPNGRFLYWEGKGENEHPTFWGIVRNPAGAGDIHLLRPIGPGAPETGLRFQLADGGAANRSYLLLDTYITFPHRPIELWVNVPARANLLPDLDMLYGINLTVDHKYIWVLFGDRAARGRASNNTYYWMAPAPRGKWSRQTVDLRKVLDDLGIRVTPLRKRMPRFHHLDFAFVPTNFQLLLAARNHAGPAEALFGPVRSQSIRPDVAALFRLSRSTPEALPLWQGDHNFAMRNFDAARDHYRAAVRVSPRSERAHLQLGEAEFWRGDCQAASAAYRVALEINPDNALAHKGLGWCCLTLDKDAEALRALSTALSIIERRNDPLDRLHLADIHKGLGMVLLRQNDCARAEQHLRRMKALDPTQKLPVGLDGCVVDKVDR